MRPLLGFILSAGAGTEGVARESKGTTAVLFLSITVEVSSKADVRLDLLLAIAEVVISDDGKDHTLLGTQAHLEGLAIVVALILGLPAHALSTLLLGGFIPLGKAKRLLGDLVEMRSHDDETSVAGPVHGVKSSIILRKEWITSIAEHGLDEVEAADEAARSKAKDLHSLNRAHAGNLRHNDGTQKKTANEVDRSQRRRRSGVGGERGRIGRIKCLIEHTSKDSLGNSKLVRADDELILAVSDVEGASSGTLVETRVMENTTVLDLVRRHVLIDMTVCTKREAELTSNTVLAEHKGLEGHLGSRHASLGLSEDIVDELVDTAHDRSRHVSLQQTSLLTIVTDEISRAGRQQLDRVIHDRVARMLRIAVHSKHTLRSEQKRNVLVKLSLTFAGSKGETQLALGVRDRHESLNNFALSEFLRLCLLLCCCSAHCSLI